MKTPEAISGMIDASPWHLEYLILGHGATKVLAFHGFDNNAEDFKVFSDCYQDSCTFISVNLFFHGRSQCDLPSDVANFSEEALRSFIDLLCDRLQVDRFLLLGFSLGGRICLKIAELFPEKISGMMLLAPDGLRLSRWYRFVTANPMGRMIFKRTIHHPKRFMKVASWMKSLNLVGEKQYKFAINQFDTEAKRRKVYDVWMIFRHLIPNKKKLRSTIKQYGYPVEIYFGKRDTIIPSAFGVSLKRRDDNHITIHILDAGHQLMQPATVEAIAKLTAILK